MGRVPARRFARDDALSDLAQPSVRLGPHIDIPGDLDQRASALNAPMKTDSGPLQYSPVAIALHWIVAAFILMDFALAESFSRFNPGDALYFTWAYPAHMSVGMCALVIGAGRLLWRGSHTYPRVPQDMNFAARILASATHAMLYVFMVAAPVTGWVVLSVRKKPPVLFGSL